MKSFRVLAAGLGVVVLWATAFPAIRVAAPALGVSGLSFLRLAIAAIALLAIAPFAHVRRPERGHVLLVAAAAFFGMTAYQVLLNGAELHVPAGTASIVVASAPLVSVAIATLGLGERLTVAKIAGSSVAIAGVVVVCLSRSGASFTSAIWIVIGAAVVQGIYHPLTKPLLRTRSGLEVATYAMVAGTVMALPLLPWGWDRLGTAPLSAWGSALYLALMPSALGFVLWGYAVANLPMATSTSLLYLVPAVAVLIAFVWLGEVPYATELLGGLVVVAGVVLISQGDRLKAQLRGRRDSEGIEPPFTRHASEGSSGARWRVGRSRRVTAAPPRQSISLDRGGASLRQGRPPARGDEQPVAALLAAAVELDASRRRTSSRPPRPGLRRRSSARHRTRRSATAGLANLPGGP